MGNFPRPARQQILVLAREEGERRHMGQGRCGALADIEQGTPLPSTSCVPGTVLGAFRTFISEITQPVVEVGSSQASKQMLGEVK